ncbi:hypothetical protein [Oscillatoria acuminata]|uniref:Uncharacterized protein n=1 Tax=Oscillatoria acuminata PCC 6304 TaxID=56110 RepID=K9TDX6_9CYAN|nr:hypothetical protein [Oscillatoria acuminata]AFY80623.1 hypothetical protein Oscil6304_0890 [Oscillatoria acuminata PCC 6304]
MKPKYTLNDLKRRPSLWSREGSVQTHTHTVEFSRSLTETEQQQFITLLMDFPSKVKQEFPDLKTHFLDKTEVWFDNPGCAKYTLHQIERGGEWKDLLFSLLAKFSQEVAIISKHDGNPVFAKAQTKPVELTEIIEQQREDGGDRTPSTPESTDATEQGRSADEPLFTYASKEEVWEAYLAVEQEWEEVFRRLADS